MRKIGLVTPYWNNITKEELIEIAQLAEDLGYDSSWVPEMWGRDAAGEKLYSIMEPFGKLAFNVAELGIGTHDKAQITGDVLEDEKAIGTVHIAFGDNKSMGGTIRVASHLDGVIMEPTVSVDGETIMEKGKLLIL